MAYQMIIGIETHVELKSERKIFCNCKVGFAKEPNTDCCPYCKGEGKSPNYNGEVTRLALKAGLSLNCKTNKTSAFDRKHYKSADMPKGYQITQYFTPICQDGYLVLNSGKKIDIKRIHIEEDSAKSVYGDKTVIDFNRSGIPLIEIVTAPDLSNQEEACEFVEKLQSVIRYSGASDCKMERGQMRFDINLSLCGQSVKGERVEIKNLNSIGNIKRAIKSEYDRQSQLLDSGKGVLKQTLKFDEKAGKCIAMREKEDATDYAYSPETQLPLLVLKQDFIDKIKQETGELPDQKTDRFIKEYSLKENTTKILCKYKKVAQFFEEAVKRGANALTVANLITGTIFSQLSEEQKEVFSVSVTPEDFVKITQYINQGLSFNNAQKAIIKLLNGSKLEQVIKKEDLQTLTKEEIMKLCIMSIQQNTTAVKKYKGGNCKAINALVGYCIKSCDGRADAKQIEQTIIGLIRE